MLFCLENWKFITAHISLFALTARRYRAKKLWLDLTNSIEAFIFIFLFRVNLIIFVLFLILYE